MSSQTCDVFVSDLCVWNSHSEKFRYLRKLIDTLIMHLTIFFRKILKLDLKNVELLIVVVLYVDKINIFVYINISIK